MSVIIIHDCQKEMKLLKKVGKRAIEMTATNRTGIFVILWLLIILTRNEFISLLASSAVLNLFFICAVLFDIELLCSFGNTSPPSTPAVLKISFC